MAKQIFKSVILGAPGSGKSTMAAKIVKTFNLEHISSGDKLRQHIKNKTPIGLAARNYTKEGRLVPDDIMIKFILLEIDHVRPKWLLDGFPRTVSQAQALWNIHELDIALNLIVSFPVIIERLRGRWVHLPSGRVYNNAFNAPKEPGKDDVTGEPLVQREDDKPAVVQKRLEEYERLTRAVIEFYRERGILKEFAGNISEELWSKIMECLETYLPIEVKESM